MHYIKRNNDPKYEPVTLVIESPNGHREYQGLERWNAEQLIEDGFFIDKYGFKWKAWIEGY